VSTPIPVRTVDGSLQQFPLNFRNQIFHSFVDSFSRDEEDSGLSVKLVIAGSGERYKVGDRMHLVSPGRFLVVNHHQRFQCRVRSADAVEGMCFYLDPGTVAEIHDFHRSGHGRMLERGSGKEVPPPTFTEKVFGVSESPLGKFLAAMLPTLRDPKRRQRVDFPQFFLAMAERMVQSQLQTDLLVQNLGNEKPSTREELYRRISLARIYIDEHYLQDIHLDQLAAVSMTSKYHFLRCFKEIYRCSPYQYVLKKRLHHCIQLLQRGKRSLAEIALETGFTDRRALNQAFKKMFGATPTAYREGSWTSTGSHGRREDVPIPQ
jgi:AraC family transcriptional regulator